MKATVVCKSLIWLTNVPSGYNIQGMDSRAYARIAQWHSNRGMVTKFSYPLGSHSQTVDLRPGQLLTFSKLRLDLIDCLEPIKLFASGYAIYFVRTKDGHYWYSDTPLTQEGCPVARNNQLADGEIINTKFACFNQNAYFEVWVKGANLMIQDIGCPDGLTLALVHGGYEPIDLPAVRYNLSMLTGDRYVIAKAVGFATDPMLAEHQQIRLRVNQQTGKLVEYYYGLGSDCLTITFSQNVKTRRLETFSFNQPLAPLPASLFYIMETTAAFYNRFRALA